MYRFLTDPYCITIAVFAVFMLGVALIPSPHTDLRVFRQLIVMRHVLVGAIEGTTSIFSSQSQIPTGHVTSAEKTGLLELPTAS